MLIQICKSKLHNARVTTKNKDYLGSLLIDKNLMKKANISPYEIVLVINIENGERFETYVIPGKDGEIGLQGGAARLGEIGDRLIIISHAYLTEEEIKNYKPKIIILNEKNKPVKEINT